MTKKIRIGNDIRIAVDLRLFIVGKGALLERSVFTSDAPSLLFRDNNDYVDNSELLTTSDESGTEGYQNPDIDDSIPKMDDFIPTESKLCIRSVKAKFINTTRREEEAESYKQRSRFISRFPMEPGIEAFHTTPYDVCNSGWYSWAAHPRNHSPYYYAGYGINPKFDGLYNPLAMTNDTEYIADVAATTKQHIVEVIFPAEHQYHVGKYTLVLVAKIFAPGYNNQNLKTITVDIPDIIELVKTTEEGEDTGIIVNVSAIQEHLPEGDMYTPYLSDIFVNGMSSEGDNIIIHRTDSNDISLNLSDKTGWYEGD